MSVRQNAPVIGAQSAYPEPNDIQLSLSYRYQRSHRHFRGDAQQRNRTDEESEVKNDLHLWDVAGTYFLDEQTSFTVSLPVQYAERSRPLRDEDGDVVERDITRAKGIGDLAVVARRWLFGPEFEAIEDFDISLGLGVKFPTGRFDAKDDTTPALDQKHERRNVDQSIQPGDGGYGILTDFQIWKIVAVPDLVLTEYMTLYGSGTYLFNPRNVNHEKTHRNRLNESEFSVPDSYLARAGSAFNVPGVDGLGWSIGARIEGVMPRDAIGKSDGFRRPGYALSFDPGLFFSWKGHTVALNAPIALYRNRQKSFPDELDDEHGDAAFADYVILFGYSYRF